MHTDLKIQPVFKWEQIPRQKFRYNGVEVQRRTYVFKTIFGKFEVFESVGGDCFYRHPFLKSNYIGPAGFDNGLGDWFGKSKNRCIDLEDGIMECELIMIKIKKIVSEY